MQPSHPGAILKEIIKGLENETAHRYTHITIAKGLGITREKLSNILNERRRVDAEMCVRLSEAFGMSAEFWRDLQTSYDLWHAERNVDRKAIRRFWSLESERIEKDKGLPGTEKP